MNYTKLQDELLVILKDESDDIRVRIGDFINEACGQVAEETEPPKLKEPFTVTTVVGVNHLDLTATFSGKLTFASRGEDGDLQIVSNLESLMRLYPGLAETGDLEVVCCEDAILYYQPIPTAATSIYCVGYMLPDTLTTGTDTPDWAPDYLHRELFVYKAAEIAYNLIEDGVDGQKRNTLLYANLYQLGKSKMQNWVNKRGRTITRFKHYV
jgi:hypothetical protein